jgi:phosphotriesterase-related protein
VLQLLTTLGPKQQSELGMILPHEHIFVDLGPKEERNYERAEAAEVTRMMAPELEKARAAGVTALVESTPVGVGRRVDIVKAVSEASTFPVVVPTGIYREPWVPEWAHKASEAELGAWMLAELTGEIEGSGVRAGWIKVSAGDDGLTACEAKILRAAATAGAATGAVIGSHSVKGRVVQRQLDIVEQVGYSAERFIWIHTQAEPDLTLHLEMAQRGAWLEYDWIGSETVADGFFTERIMRLLEAGLAHRLLLSHDRGWYDPSKPGGGTAKPFSYLSERFLPNLAAAGVDEATIHQLTHTNPFFAFAREGSVTATPTRAQLAT